MTPNELRIEEAVQSIRLLVQNKSERWTQAVLDEGMDVYRTLNLKQTDHVYVQERLTEALKDSITRRCIPEMLQESILCIQQTELFTTDELDWMKRSVGSILHDASFALSVVLPRTQSVLDPLRSTGAVSICAFLGWILGSQLSSHGFVPALLCWLGGTGGAWGLVRLFQDTVHGTGVDSAWKSRMGSFFWRPSAHKEVTFPHIHVHVNELLQSMGQIVASLMQLAARLQLRSREERDEETDQLQHLFTQCIDGFSEVVYAEEKRDPERALDACIKLIGDLQNVGIQVERVERGTPFSSHIETQYHISGRVREGDPVMTIFPMWRWKERLLSKGTIKRTRR